MENLKRKKLRAYILLESLIALAVFAFICSLTLESVAASRRQERELLAREERLRLFDMALKSGESQLDLNGQEIRLERSSRSIRAWSGEEEVLHVEKK